MYENSCRGSYSAIVFLFADGMRV